MLSLLHLQSGERKSRLGEDEGNSQPMPRIVWKLGAAIGMAENNGNVAKTTYGTHGEQAN
jgi:hypothetical protein